VRFLCGGQNKDTVYTLILNDVTISAAICHPLPSSHHLPPDDWLLQLCKSLDQTPRIIYGSVQSSIFGSIIEYSMMHSLKGKKLYAYHSNVVNTQVQRSSYCHASNMRWITIPETYSL